MRSFLVLIFLATSVLSFSSLTSCKLFRPSHDNDDILDENALPESLSGSDELTSVPSTLWSPFQRKANAGYYFLSSEYMLLEGNPKKATPLLEAAYALDPNSFLGGRLAAAKAASGREADALADVKKMILLYPKNAQLRFLYGQLLSSFPDSSVEAEKQLEKAIALDPSLEGAYLFLIETHQKAKDYPKAIAVSKDLVKNIPKSIIGWSVLSRLYLITRDKKKALDPAKRAYQMQSSNPELTLVYALALELNGQSKEAVQLYEQLYRLDPSNEDLIARMVSLYSDLGDLNDALDILTELIKSSPSPRPGIEMQRAIILWELKKFKEASEILVRLAKEYPDSDRLQYMSALGYEKLEQYDKAVEIYKAIPDNSQFKIHASVRIAGVFQRQKRFDEAYDVLKDLLEDNPQNADLYGFTASVLSELERPKESVELIDTALEKFPDQKPKFLFLKGVYQEKAGDRDGCIKTMQTVIKIAPNNPDALNYLGYLYAETGEKLDEAETLIKRALKIKPDNGFYLDSLAWVFYQKKEYDKALKLLELAIAKEPEEGVIMEHFGDIYQALKKLDQTKDYYEKALKTKLDKRDRKRVEEKLKKLK